MTDPYASEEETRALLRKDTRTPAERKLDRMLKDRGASEQGAEPTLILRQIALELLADPAQGCNYCNHALYAGTKCKNCGRVTMPAAIKRDLTPEQPAQQEPVAGLLVGQDSDGRYVSIAAKAHADTLPLGEYKLYTTPQAQQLPFGVSGGLVAIKTLLSRDPCAHAKVAIEMIDAMLSEQPAHQEPVVWTDLLKTADEIVRGKTVWKRFIDGTPLANDIAVWMADFVQQHTSPPASKPWVGLDHDDIHALMNEYFYEGMQPSAIHFANFARAIEAKLKEKNT